MAGNATPGWYHAQGDPPGTERFWDGSAWTEGPRPVGGVPSAPPAAPATPPEAQPMGSASSFGDAAGTDAPLADMAGTEIPTFGAPSGDAPTADMPTADAPTFGGPASGGLAPSDNIASPGSPPPQAPGFPGAPPTGAAYAGIPGAVFAEESKATLALVLSILGLFCFITAPFGIFIAYKEKVAIDEGRRDPSNRGQAIAAIVIGAVMVVFGLFVIGLSAVVASVAAA